MPNPTENVSPSCPRIERGAASSEDPLLRIRRHLRSRRGPDQPGSAQPPGRELECAVPDTKPEERTGIPTPPPSDPESDSGESLWTRRQRDLRDPAREKQEEKSEEEDMVHLHSADTPLSSAQSPVVGYDTDAGLAQSMSTTSISSLPRYLHYFESERNWNNREKLTTSFLRPGSKFVGTQKSDRQKYEVSVEIKDVDLENSFLCGYLRIQGLTDEHPTLITFFEGEIVGPKYKFITSHSTWGSSMKNDMTHWSLLPKWKQLAKSSRTENFTVTNHLQREQLWMRWKEYFLVPDHRVKTISGASFEGFYYICFNQHSGTVDGVYYHHKSEKYQTLRLEHVDDRGCEAAVEFR